jgi:membrane-associated protease RseP (regulator of RpoE activity)
VRLVAGDGRGAAAPGGALGLVLTPPGARGVPVVAVRPGSAAAAAGLRPGDRLLRVGDAAAASAAAAERLLAGAATRGAFVVFERDSVERGVLVRAAPGAAP